MKISIFEGKGELEVAVRFWDHPPRKGELIQLYGEGHLDGTFEVVEVHWAGDERQYLLLKVEKLKSK